MTESEPTQMPPVQSPASPARGTDAPLEWDCGFGPQVSAYHDDELPLEQSRELELHLAQCPNCARSLGFMRSVSGKFTAAPPTLLAPEARERLSSLDPRGVRAVAGRIGPSADVRWARRLSAVAALFFVLAAGRLVYQQRFGSGTHPANSNRPGHVEPLQLPGSPNPPSKVLPATSSSQGDKKDVDLAHFQSPDPSNQR